LDCAHEIVSAAVDADESPLAAALDAVDRPGRRSVIDLGCGTGWLLPRLIDRFGHVVGLDRSARMLALARERLLDAYGELPDHVELRQGSIGHAGVDSERHDVCVALNSVLMPEPRAVRRALRGIHRRLKRGGKLLAVFPALESLREIHQHCWQRALRAGRSPEVAWRRVRETLVSDRINFALGHVDVGYMVQKHHTANELAAELERAGFRDLRHGRVVYRREVQLDGSDLFGGRRPRSWHHFFEGAL